MMCYDYVLSICSGGFYYNIGLEAWQLCFKRFRMSKMMFLMGTLLLMVMVILFKGL